MFPVTKATKNKQEKALLDFFRKLDDQDQHALLRYAEFLVANASANENTPTADVTNFEANKPLSIERPETESVIQAIKRLSKTYPMINQENLLHRISDLMTGHIMQGKEAQLVIDELQDLFSQEYEKLNIHADVEKAPELLETNSQV